MSSRLEFGRSLELNAEYDVIVAGGGPAGCSAAAAAAREGARTLLVEATGALGGMGTSGLVPAWCPFTDKEKIIYGGIAEKILKQCIAGMPHVAADRYDWTPIDPELLKRLYDELVVSSGADILFNTQVASVEAEDGTVEALILANKAGLTAYKAGVYVDCTGDGDVAAWAGAEIAKGDSNGVLQPMTHCFVLTNVDEYGYRTEPNLHPNNPNSPIYDILKSGRYPLIPDRHCCQNQIGPRAVGFNAGHIWKADNTDPVSVSAALVHGRKMACEFQKALAEFCPKSFGNAFLAATGSLIGTRETRRVIGDYYLTVEELMAFTSYEDEICRNCYFIDVHHNRDEIGTKKEGSAHCFRFPPGKSHGIPYRCLTPKGLSNVLVAGRTISTDRSSNGSTRVMPVCLATGEAAGIAAAMSARQPGNDVHRVDTADLRQRLIGHGAWLPTPEQ